MYRTFYFFLAVTLLFTGCGKKMTGRYEAINNFPQLQIAGADPALQKQMREIQDMTRMTLEFDGSKVRMGNGLSVSEHRYRVKGTRLEVIAEVMGQKNIVPMTIEPDGSISYQIVRFVRVD